MEVLSQYFEETPTNFSQLKKQLNEKNIIIKENTNLGLFLLKYNKELCEMTDPLVQQCRGLVGRIDNLSLVCLPPIKSEKLEQFTNNINWEDIEIEEFVDGTMINMFYYNEEWLISTRSKIGANCRWIGKKNFDILFSESNGDLDWDLLDKQCYYTFVLTHPENRIVKEYSEPSLVLVQVGRVLDGKNELLELRDQNIGIPTPTTYNINNLNEAIVFTNNQTYDFQGLVLKNGNRRSKIRNAKYNYARSLKSNTNNLCFLYFYLKKNMFDYDYLKFYPEHKEYFEKYNNNFEDLVTRVFENYKNYHMMKKISIQDMPFRLRPLCYEIHGIYLSRKENITPEHVKNYLVSLPIPRILFSLKI